MIHRPDAQGNWSRGRRSHLRVPARLPEVQNAKILLTKKGVAADVGSQARRELQVLCIFPVRAVLCLGITGKVSDADTCALQPVSG